MTNVKPGDPIQPALNAGDVKLLAGGPHAPGVLVVPSGRIIANEKGAILRGATLNLKGASNVRLPDGLELDGANARTAMILENASGVQIDGLFCHNYGEGLYVNGLADSWVRGSHFENVGGQASNTAIFGYNPKRCDFSNSLYKACGEGIHFFWKLGDKKTNKANRDDVTITFNQFRSVRRHPIELQEGVRGLKVWGNWIGDWTSAIKSIIGISAALGGDPSAPGPDAWEIEIWENVIDGTNLPVTDPSQFMGIEVMGFDPWVHHNDINNMGQPIAVTFNASATKIEANNVRGTVRPPQSWWKDDKGIIVADVPGDRYVPVIDIGNRWSTDPMPGPPVDGGGGSPVITNVKATEANPPVVTWTGGAATVTRTDQNGKTDVKPDGSPAVFPNAVSPFTDTFVPKDHYDNTWHVRYAVGDAQPVLIQLPKPVTPPSTEYDFVTTTVQHFKDGKPSGNPTVATVVKQAVAP